MAAAHILDLVGMRSRGAIQATNLPAASFHLIHAAIKVLLIDQVRGQAAAVDREAVFVGVLKNVEVVATVLVAAQNVAPNTAGVYVHGPWHCTAGAAVPALTSPFSSVPAPGKIFIRFKSPVE